jgi:DNA-binding response OmpR family regulator
VEDNAILAGTLVRLLTRMDHAVEHVECCANAREIEGSFDLGVLDIELPDGLGIDVGSDLLSRGTIGGVVFFSGTMDDVLLRRARDLGPCVAKSEGAVPLLDAIRAALANRPGLATRSSRAARSSALD